MEFVSPKDLESFGSLKCLRAHLVHPMMCLFVPSHRLFVWRGFRVWCEGRPNTFSISSPAFRFSSHLLIELAYHTGQFNLTHFEIPSLFTNFIFYQECDALAFSHPGELHRTSPVSDLRFWVWVLFIRISVASNVQYIYVSMWWKSIWRVKYELESA